MEKGKRDASASPGGRKAKKEKNVNNFQIAEFLWSFLQGTATVPVYEEIEWILEAEANSEVEAMEAPTDYTEVEDLV